MLDKSDTTKIMPVDTGYRSAADEALTESNGFVKCFIASLRWEMRRGGEMSGYRSKIRWYAWIFLSLLCIWGLHYEIFKNPYSGLFCDDADKTNYNHYQFNNETVCINYGVSIEVRSNYIGDENMIMLKNNNNYRLKMCMV